MAMPEILADKHPGGLGQPTRECWPEVWHINGPIYQRVWQGETITYEDKLYPLARRGAAGGCLVHHHLQPHPR